MSMAGGPGARGRPIYRKFTAFMDRPGAPAPIPSHIIEKPGGDTLHTYVAIKSSADLLFDDERVRKRSS